MTQTRRAVYGAVLLLAILCGCARSPEARRDKYVARGKAFLDKHDYSRAIIEFKNAVHAMPNDPDVYYQLGMAAYASGDLKTAVVAYRKALDLNPKHPGAQLRMAQLMASASEDTWLKDAEARLQELMTSTPENTEVLNTLAFTELRLGKTDSAVQTLESALAKAPQQLNSSILLARAKLVQNDAKGAEEILKKACDAAPGSADPRAVLGRFYAAQKRINEAEAEFQEALKINPKSWTALMDLTSLQYSQGRKQEAESNFKRLAASGEAMYKPVYGTFLFTEGRLDEAIREFERLHKENPEDRGARTRLVAAYRETNRTADAEKILDKALKDNAKDLDALLQRGEMFMAAGKYSQAEADLNQVVRLKPDSAEVHYIVGKLHQARGQRLTYRQDLMEALRLNPYSLAVRLELVQDLLNNKEPQAASDVLSAAPDSQKESTAVLVQRNWVLWAEGNMAEMRRGIDRGLSRERSPDLLVQDGIWKLQSGNPSAARTALEEALHTNPGDVRALAALRQSYVAQNQASVALQKVKEYAARQPKSAPVQEFLGTLLMASGDRQQARTAFVAAKAADPKFVRADLSLIQADIGDGKLDDAQRRLQAMQSSGDSSAIVKQWLANVAVMKGDQKSALVQFRQVVTAEPGNAEALNNLAYLIAENGGELSEALKYAQKAQEIAPDNANYRDTLGWILYHQGLYPLAIKELERAAEAKNGSPVSKYHLAMAYAKAGDLKRGHATLETALKTNPNLPEAKAAREMLGSASN